MDKGRIAVYCSASRDIDPGLNKVAREFVRAASLSGYTIVSGGTVKGTMGEICEETASCGGHHVGVLPRFMETLASPYADELVWTDTVSERKAAMREGTVASVALPGGIGTLDEIIEALTLKKLKFYSGKIILFNYKGFYAPLVSLLDYYVESGMLEKDVRDMVLLPESVDELMEVLQQ